MSERAIEAAHRKAVEAAEASSRASGGQPYDGYPAPAYEVYRDALFAALAEDDAAVDRGARYLVEHHDGMAWDDVSDGTKITARWSSAGFIRALGE